MARCLQKLLTPFVAVVVTLWCVNAENCLDTFVGNPINVNVTQLACCGWNNPKTIPASVAKLSKLTSMSMSWCSLIGTLPSGISALPKLKYLFLGRNNLNGTLPSELAKLTSATEIVLGWNSFTGEVPNLAAIESLEYLELRSNSLSGIVPSALGAMRSLQTLRLKENRFVSPLPTFSNTVTVDITDTDVSQFVAVGQSCANEQTTMCSSGQEKCSSAGVCCDRLAIAGEICSSSSSAGSQKGGPDFMEASIAGGILGVSAAAVSGVFMFRRRKQQQKYSKPKNSDEKPLHITSRSGEDETGVQVDSDDEGNFLNEQLKGARINGTPRLSL